MQRGRPPGNGPGGRRERLERARKSREARVRGLGWLLIGLGFLVVPVAVAIVLLVGVGGAASGLIGALTITAIAFLVTLGRRMKAREAERLLESDPRPPVVYLRPFESDRAPAVASPWLSRRRTRLFRSRFAGTYEQRLARALRDVGPFVTVGDPTERLPQLGAARFYADDAEWRETVASLTTRAAVIVLQVGESDGLAWELQHVVGVGEPERVILGLPLETGPKRQERYDAFRRKFGDLFPRGLPETIGESQFVFFEPDWTPGLHGQRHSPRLEAAPGSPGAARALALNGLGKEFKLLFAPLWVRAAAYSLIVVLAAVAIYQLGGGAGVDVPPTETQADVVGSDGGGGSEDGGRERGGYPNEVVDNFMASCESTATSEAGAVTADQARAICRCVIDEFQRTLSLDEFLRYGADASAVDPPELPNVIDNTIDKCMANAADGGEGLEHGFTADDS